MLSEAWRLLQALERTGAEALERKHKRVQEPGRTNRCLRVRLSREGAVAAVEDVDQSDWPNWTVMDGNQNSFPVIRAQEPIFEAPAELWERLGYKKGLRRRELLPQADRVSLLCEVPESPILSSKKRATLWHRLREKAGEILACPPDSRLACVNAVATRFIAAPSSPEPFLRQVAEAALSALRSGTLTADDVERLLVGKGPPDANGKRPPATVQLALDLADPEGFPHAVYSRQTRTGVIEQLPPTPTKTQTKGTGKQGVDALTGAFAELEEETLPKVNLPVPSSRDGHRVGRRSVPLASMFSDARCNYRYGLTDAAVFPVAKQTALNLKEALESVTADERWGQTWQFVASGRFDTSDGRKFEKQDLLIVFVEECPRIDAKTARYFAGADVFGKQFEADAEVVCARLRAVVKDPPKSRLSLFLIRQVSKGQAQVTLAEAPTVQQLLDGTERWVSAVKQNTPHVSLFLPKTERFEAARAEPLPPYPDQVVRLLSHQWVRDGSSPRGPDGRPTKPSHELVGPGLGDVLNLMLRIEGKCEPAARRLLSMLVQRLTPLLIGLFGAKHAFRPRAEQGGHEPLCDYPRPSREAALRTVAVAAILLDALGHYKEYYMSNAPYQVGQVLALADTLHKDYCIVVRKGKLPPSLIGTALMRRALDNPAAAIADLGERLMEYVRWAKTADVPRSQDEEQERIAVHEARKKLRQYQPLAAALGTAELPTETNDVVKAQLLLGFLASPPDEDEERTAPND